MIYTNTNIYGNYAIIISAIQTTKLQSRSILTHYGTCILINKIFIMLHVYVRKVRYQKFIKLHVAAILFSLHFKLCFYMVFGQKTSAQFVTLDKQTICSVSNLWKNKRFPKSLILTEHCCVKYDYVKGLNFLWKVC